MGSSHVGLRLGQTHGVAHQLGIEYVLHGRGVDFHLQDAGIDRASRRSDTSRHGEIVNSRPQRVGPSLYEQIAMSSRFRSNRNHAVRVLWVGSESPGTVEGYKDLLRGLRSCRGWR